MGFPGLAVSVRAQTFLLPNLAWRLVFPAAYRANLLSALVSSLASVIMFFVIRELLVLARTKRPTRAVLMAAVFGAVFYSLSPIVWMYSIHAEVFPLNNLLISAVFYLMLRYQRTLEYSVALAGAFMCGLALTNQQYVVINFNSYQALILL